jgi:hypothetical protein
MCHDGWMWRRRRQQAEESREMWEDFERTTPLADREREEERPEPERAEAREEIVTTDR